jgi:hypothetical protein
VVRTTAEAGRAKRASEGILVAAIGRPWDPTSGYYWLSNQVGHAQVPETSSARPVDVTYSVYQRVVLTRHGRRLHGRILAIDPYKRHPYLVHLDEDDSYTRAAFDELEAERR